MSPFLNATSIGTLVVLVAIGAAVALVAGSLFQRHPERGEPTIEVLDRDEPTGRRVNG